MGKKEEGRMIFEGEGKDLGELDTLKNYVTILRLMKKGLNFGMIGKVMGYSQEKIRAFNGLVTRKKDYFNPSKYDNEYERQSDIEDCVKLKTSGKERPGREPGKKFIDLLILRNDLRKGLSNKNIAKLFEVDEKDFEMFMEKNQKHLDLLV